MSQKGLFGPDRLKITVAGRGEMEACGSFADHEIAIFLDGRKVSQFSRTLIAGSPLGDPYGFEIEDSQDQLLLLCCAVVIDELHDLHTG